MTYFPSKAFIKASELEKSASYPRVIIDEELLCAIGDETKRKYLVKDVFGAHFIHYIGQWNSCQKEELQDFIAMRKLETRGKEKNKYEKYVWLESYYRWTYTECINFFSRP